LNHYQYASTVTDSFKVELERSSGKNLQAYFQEWIYGEGYPTYQLKWNYQPGTGKIHFQLGQSASMPGVTSNFTNDVPVKVDVAGQSFIFRLRGNTAGIQSFAIPQAVLRVTIDPDNWIISGTNTVLNDPTLVPASVSASTQSPWMVLPNPSSGQFWIENPANVQLEMGVFDVQGRKFMDFQVLPRERKMLELPTGMYMVIDQFGKTQKAIVR
jgi:hypothetical protein